MSTSIRSYHFKITYRAFKFYSFVPLKGGATAGMHILRLPTNYTTHFSGVFRHISRAVLT